MASQQQNIDGSSIDLSNVQQTQAGRDAVSFQNSHDNQVIIENTFLKLFPQSDRSQVDWEWGLRLLQEKQLPEIRKRLTDTLGRDRILMDVSIEEQQKWVNRSPLAADRILQIDGKNCGTLNPDRMLIETFGRDDIKGKLLILGAPGAGKTTALLSLTEQLVCGAISQPKTVIPVIFELSTWRDDKQSIQDWLIEQLYDLHGGSRKSKLYEQWLERQVLLPLLDGLDELGLERQKKCTQKLNEFAEHYPQMVVCCRVKEFEAVDIRLRNLRGAVCLQSLSDSQIQDYLGSLKRPELWEAIQTTPYLTAMLEPTTEGDPGLLRVPLFVKLVADVYDPQQPISSKADLLDKYIDRQLSFDKREIDRRKELREYKWAYKTVKLEPDWKKTRSNLDWLAQSLQDNNKVDFLIEHMQPNWLEPARLQERYSMIYGNTSLLFHVFLLGILMWYSTISIHLLFLGLILAMLAIAVANILALRYGETSWDEIDLVESLQALTASKNLRRVFIAFRHLIVNNINSQFKLQIRICIFAGIFTLIPGLVIGFFSWNDLIYSFRTWNDVADFFMELLKLFSSLVINVSILNIIVNSRQLFTRLITDLKQEIKLRSSPNQGIWKSFQNTIFVTLTIFLIFKLLSVLAIGDLSLQCTFTSIIIGITAGGGKACFQHLSLRIVLWQSGLPWNFARFLNYCVERRLLLRVGGSYRFLHRELLDHFAQSNH